MPLRVGPESEVDRDGGGNRGVLGTALRRAWVEKSGGCVIQVSAAWRGVRLTAIPVFPSAEQEEP
jgi:hypothetical protein